jgi:hypothetical protein
MTMTDSQPTTARTTLTERAEQRTLAKRRRRVWRNLLFFVVVTLAIVVLSLLNRDEQAIRSCRERMEYAVRVFQEREDKGEPPLPLLPLPDKDTRADDAERRLMAWRDHTHYNVLYSERVTRAREVGVCCCLHAHTRLLWPVGRYVVILDAPRRRYELRWMDEREFADRADDLELRVPGQP